MSPAAAPLGPLLLLLVRAATALEVRGLTRALPAARPVTKIVFIKTYWTGSETLTGILNRYCDLHEVGCFSHPMSSSAEFTAERSNLEHFQEAASRRNETVSIWSDHSNLEPDVFDKWIPGNVKVSVFRDPIARTVASYASTAQRGVGQAMEWLQRGTLTAMELCKATGAKMSDQIHLDQFPLLGYVLLTEYHDLGLVMMRHRFGWAKEDIVYLKPKANVSASLGRSGSVAAMRAYLSRPKSNLSSEASQVLATCAGGDEAELYGLARVRFQMQWDEFSNNEQQEIVDEVQAFHVAMENLNSCCANLPTDEYCEILREYKPEWAHQHRLKKLNPRMGCRNHGFVTPR